MTGADQHELIAIQNERCNGREEGDETIPNRSSGKAQKKSSSFHREGCLFLLTRPLMDDPKSTKSRYPIAGQQG
jgi:hypothetical protein